MQHSNIVGGSSAKRVMACPGSVALVQQMPPKPSNSHADQGTLLHNVISEYLGKDSVPLQSFVGYMYADQELTLELMEEKLLRWFCRLAAWCVWLDRPDGPHR